MEKKIYYGFGKDYLPNWGLQQALREIYQNFLDYGDYSESVTTEGDISTVSLVNDWKPTSLDFLRIGNSRKEGTNAIGKHGEGIKMAFFILERERFKSAIFTDKYVIHPEFYNDQEIGECFCLVYEEHETVDKKFTVKFDCPTNVFIQFKNNLIIENDILFSHEYGDIVDKDKGNIYAGGLFVVKVDNMNNAYNIKPRYLPLDRDRSVPRSFDVSYYSSKINSAHGQLISLKTLSHTDNLYIDDIPVPVKEKIQPKIIGNTVEFTYQDEDGEDKVITNDNAKELLKRDNFFAAAVKKLKVFIAKQLGLYDLLLEFKEKHVHSTDAIADFELILERVKS